MTMPVRTRLMHAIVLCVSVLVCGITPAADAQTTGDLPKLDLDQTLRPVFAGSWEKDFQRSDNWETELERILRIRREAMERQRRGSSADIGVSQRASSIAGNSGRRGGASVIELARLAEYISRQTTIHITQNRFEVRIEREGDASLVCNIEGDVTSSFSSAYGSEICGWDRNQLVFQTRLPDDLVIVHRFNVASDRQHLSLVISITSRGSEPFNLRQTYNRYDAPVDEFNCTQTLSRGRVCSQTPSRP